MSTKLLETIKDVHAAFATAGYGTIRPNTKTHGYKSPRGRIVYLSLSQTRPPWRLAVHPDTSMDVLRVAGIEIADKLYHGSNMREFPKERHGGQKPMALAAIS